MRTLKRFSRQCRLWACGLTALCGLSSGLASAQTPAPRIMSQISSTEMTALKGSQHPRALAQYDAGRMPADTKIDGVSIVFNRTAVQQADLEALIAAQQNPSSPLYHQWLTPEQFAARFGMAQADIEKVEAWLQQQGFSIDSVARSHNVIRFSGTVRQIEQSFQTEMHYYKANGEQHFAPSTELSTPKALAAAVAGINNLDDFRARPMHVRNNSARMRPNYTIASNPDMVFFAAGDLKVVYDFPAAGTGYNGSGQKIAIVGQSAIQTSDITTFQSLNGLPQTAPTLMLVPGTGNSQVYADGDEGESDIDIEWAGAAAPGATIVFVYTGNSNNNGIFDSLAYAIDNNVAPIVSSSYGGCEQAQSQSFITSQELIYAQAATQGQTIFASSGDTGSTGCFGLQTTPALSTQVQQSLAVNYPASSAYVVAVGGTEISSANDAVGQYWSGPVSNSTPALTTALSYIPEVAWNDDAVAGQYSPSQGGGLSASGGGASLYIPRPSWQQQGQAPGIPSGSFRLVPDVALYSSPNYPGYLYCTSDSTDWQPAYQGYPAQQGSCTSGFLDTTGYYPTVAGGTSFAAPIFAGMLAVLNQAKGYDSTGQGLINPLLYQLANTSTAYTGSTAPFHDITSGNNYCTAGTTYGYCSSSGSTEGFAATTGYDEVTGLGSVDVNNLIATWAASTGPTLVTTSTSVSASPTSPNVNQTVTFTVTVTAADKTTPGGNISLSVDGGSATSEPLGSNGTYVYTTTFATAGSHVVTAQYAANGSYAGSSGSAQVSVQTVSSGKGTISLSATPATLTVTQGSSANETVTVTPAGGYTGTVLLIFDTNNDNALQNLCYNFTNINNNGYGPVPISGTAAASTQLTLDTSANDCATGYSQKAKGMMRLGGPKTAKNNSGSPIPAGIAFAGLLMVGLLGRYSRKLSALAGLAAIAALGLSLSACGGNNSVVSSISNPPKGTYTITVTGQDSVTSSITGSTTFTFVIQ